MWQYFGRFDNKNCSEKTKQNKTRQDKKTTTKKRQVYFAERRMQTNMEEIMASYYFDELPSYILALVWDKCKTWPMNYRTLFFSLSITIHPYTISNINWKPWKASDGIAGHFLFVFLFGFVWFCFVWFCFVLFFVVVVLFCFVCLFVCLFFVCFLCCLFVCLFVCLLGCLFVCLFVLFLFCFFVFVLFCFFNLIVIQYGKCELLV